VRPWVFGIARNVLGRHRRAAWRRRRSEERAVEPGDEKRWSTGSSAPQSAALDACDFDAALRRLPAGRRHAWMLHHVHGLSFQEIGERLRIGALAAKLRSSRAMKALRAALGGVPDPASGCPSSRRASEDP
jgi:RNA polymerase sigma factor (sigma-70 family)